MLQLGAIFSLLQFFFASLEIFVMRNLQIYRYVDTISRTGSIRKAADRLNITSSALNRRILSLEDELGFQIFERIGNGVRLNTAGELVVVMFRKQLAEAERLKSQLADLSGIRRGHVSIVCNQALLTYFLPNQIHKYQSEFPNVTFDIQVKDGEQAMDSLRDYSADLALVFEFSSMKTADLQSICTVRQPIQAIMATNHPLSTRESLQLIDCQDYPLALPGNPQSLRDILELTANKTSTPLTPMLTSDDFTFLRNFVGLGEAISFELPIGLPSDNSNFDLINIPLELSGDLSGLLHLAQLKDRTLQVAAARFADQLSQTFFSKFDTN